MRSQRAIASRDRHGEPRDRRRTQDEEGKLPFMADQLRVHSSGIPRQGSGEDCGTDANENDVEMRCDFDLGQGIRRR